MSKRFYKEIRFVFTCGAIGAAIGLFITLVIY